MAIFGFLAVVLWVGPLLDCSQIFLMLSKLSWSGVLASFLAGFYVNLIQAVSTALVMLLCGKALLEKLERIQLKYGMMEDSHGL